MRCFSQISGKNADKEIIIQIERKYTHRGSCNYFIVAIFIRELIESSFDNRKRNIASHDSNCDD